MSKILEALSRLYMHVEIDNDGCYDSVVCDDDFGLVYDYLESIENSSPSKALEALYRLATRNNGNSRSLEEVNKDFKIVEKALKDYESIDNANPSEALECLEKICVCARVTGLYKKEDEDVVKQALIKYQEQDFKYKNIVIPFFNELADLLGTNDIDEILDKIKEVLKAQEPKHYLKWEDLEFKEKTQEMKVKMGDILYRIAWETDGSGASLVFIYKYITNDYLECCTFITNNRQQFFNDLHLERVEE